MNPFSALLAGVGAIGAVLVAVFLIGVCLLAGGLVFGLGFLIGSVIAGTGFGFACGIFLVLLVLASIGGTLS